MNYPKIETVFKRDEKFNITDKIRCPEFKNIKKWLITEKIDGMNIRVIYKPGEPSELLFRGRTDNAQMPTYLLEVLERMFTEDKFEKIFPPERLLSCVCLYGEGYGQKIQKGGGNYNKGNSFRLFDVLIDGWWLEWDDVEEVAKQFGIKTAPKCGIMTLEKAVKIVPSNHSWVAISDNDTDILAEGIVARAYPMVLFRNKIPIKWKLKIKDFIEK